LNKTVSKEIFFATSNPHKFREVKSIFSSYNLNLKHLKVKTTEIQSENLEEIAKNSLSQVLSKYNQPIFVEDAGLFVKALKGFPGPYSSYVYKTVGVEGILKLMKNINNRKAFFLSVVVFGKPNTKPKIFTGKVEGEITFNVRGSGGFGFDPIFQPQKLKKTFSEMTLEEKNKYSHRAEAIRKLIKWLLQREF